MVWLKKGGGDNGEKCRKQRRGELDCRQRPVTLPPLTVHLQGNAMVTWCACARACVSGKCRAQACHEMWCRWNWFGFFMPALTGQNIHEYGDLTFALFSPLSSTPHADASSTDAAQPWMIWYGRGSGNCYFLPKGTVSLGDQTHKRTVTV